MSGPVDESLPLYVGIDGSDSAREAARWAARYAAHRHAPVVLVHSLPDVNWYMGTAVLAGEDELLDELRREGQHALDIARSTVQDVAPDVPVECMQTRKSVSGFFESVSKSAYLVAVGVGRSSALADLVLGGETIRVCNSIECPALVWRGKVGDDVHGKPVVVGVDGSVPSLRAMYTAFEFARASAAPLIAAHAWQVAGSVGLGYTAGLIDWDLLRKEQRTWLHERVNDPAQHFEDVAVSCASVEGLPAHHLRELSKSAQLVVVGSRGRGKITGAMLGSVSQNMIHHSDCPVLVVR